MSPCRISKLEIQGFRSFGRDAQTLEFSSPLAAIWGPNSQGKTSLAEAVEFLLTGEIVRRALMASGQDEFADALRNAHLPAGTPCFVQATIIDGDGAPHTIKRTLKTDYGKKQDCETKLEIDGAAASETAPAGIGIVLSQPPLRAPWLAQHTLGYLFSAKPQGRAGYFKALLEVTDLDEFRSAVTALEKESEVVPGPLIVKLEAEFASAVDAVRGAVEVQRGMADQNVSVPQDQRIEFRIGIHVGDIIIDDNDIFGDGVNVAARLEGNAEAGGVCMSNECKPKAHRQIRQLRPLSARCKKPVVST